MRFGQTLEAGLKDTLGEPKEPCLHVLWKRRDFGGDGFIEDFDTPRHTV